MNNAAQKTLSQSLLLTAALSAATALLGPATGNAADGETDPNTGLIIAEGWELAAAHCGGCHSHALVTARRGDADFWRSTIRWMQRTQNLWEIPSAQETALLAYLEANYNESDWGRRPPLSHSLMPEFAP